MNQYRDYMDGVKINISREEILRRAKKPAESATTKHRGKLFLSYAGAAVIALILFIGIQIAPTFFSNPGATENGATGNGATENGATGNGATENGATGNGATGNGATENDTTENDTTEIPPYALTFTQVRSEAWTIARLNIEQSFSHEVALSPEQIETLFPGVELIYSGVAVYNNSGRLSHIRAWDNKSASEHSAENAARITIWPETAVRGQLFLGLAEVSYVGDVAVTATWRYDGDRILPELFVTRAAVSADFVMDSMAYNVTLTDYTRNLDDAKLRLAEMVNSLIAAGAAEFSALPGSVALPERISRQMSLADARQDPDFGMFLPAAETIPQGFVIFDGRPANRFMDEHQNILTMTWHRTDGSLSWLISENDELTHFDNVFAPNALTAEGIKEVMRASEEIMHRYGYAGVPNVVTVIYDNITVRAVFENFSVSAEEILAMLESLG